MPLKITKKTAEKMPKCQCKNCKCDNQAEFFHSKCCNAHFEGAIVQDDAGKVHYVIICEQCGQFVAKLDIKKS